MSSLNVFALFHLNLAFSSIEEERRPQVIERCYWPLLRLIRDKNLPFGIEATAYTLETIEAIDPSWIAELKSLVSAGKCEVIASGYAQIIGPLIPAQVNAANLRLGNATYERLFEKRPALALINEQAYSPGLVPLYGDAGYRAIIMEWDNPASAHPRWNSEWRYLPQIACSQHGEDLPVIWNQSVAFQKFQRYAHGEMELDEYLDYVRGHCATQPRAFSIYGNDAEVFDFRPGRFHTEAALSQESEWKRIEILFGAIQAAPEFKIISPSAVLEFAVQPGAWNKLHLESAAQPVPVKKQSKYNITRWAVTGRDDLGVNTACYRIYEALKTKADATDADWRELCYLWSSDFRTHITEKRWNAFRARLSEFEKQICRACGPEILDANLTTTSALPLPSDVQVTREKSFLHIVTPSVSIRLNCRRGLAIDRLSFPNDGGNWLCGTLPHGYYNDIEWAADYYSGHLTFEIPGRPKITDLERVEPEISASEEGICVSANIQTSLGTIRKQLVISRSEPRVGLEYRVNWNQHVLGSLRLGHVTLNPEAFDAKTLFFKTHNGGFSPSMYSLTDAEADHGDAVSFLVSARQALGVTDGVVQIGDARQALEIRVDKTRAAVVGMLTCKHVRPSYFLRLSFSGQELDETCRANQPFPPEGKETIYKMSYALVKTVNQKPEILDRPVKSAVTAA